MSAESDAADVSAALRTWRETLAAADDLMKRTIAEARRVSNATVDEAMKACSAVLEAKSPDGIRITVGEAGPEAAAYREKQRREDATDG